MMIKNTIITCVKCGNFKKICNCFCSYCGKIHDNSDCDPKRMDFKEKAITKNLENQILVSLNSSVEKQNFIYDSENDFIYLEK